MKCPLQACVFFSLVPRWGCYLEKLWGLLHTGFSRQMLSQRDRLASTGWVLGWFCFLFLGLFSWIASVWYIVTANKHGIQLLQKMYKSTEKEGHGPPTAKGFHLAAFCSTVYTVVDRGYCWLWTLRSSWLPVLSLADLFIELQQCCVLFSFFCTGNIPGYICFHNIKTS